MSSVNWRFDRCWWNPPLVTEKNRRGGHTKLVFHKLCRTAWSTKVHKTDAVLVMGSKEASNLSLPVHCAYRTVSSIWQNSNITNQEQFVRDVTMWRNFSTEAERWKQLVTATHQTHR